MILAAIISQGDMPATTITQGGQNLNLRTLWNAANPGMTPSGPIELSIASGVVIGSSSTSTPALVTGSWPSNVTLTLRNNGRIYGAGGQGGSGNAYGAGQAGGAALEVSHALTLDNAGEIWGGGGGGGGGASQTGVVGEEQQEGDDTYCYTGNRTAGGGGGGGGAGSTPGGGGTVGSYSSQTIPPQNGSPGTTSAGGSGGAGGTAYSQCGPPSVYGIAGSRGGHPGEDGLGVNPGAAGSAVIGNNYITWVAEGDRRGPVT